MLTSGGGGGGDSGPPLRSTPEQIYVMLGPLVAAARDAGQHDTTTTTTTTTTDLLRASHAPNTTSPLDRLAAAATAASGRYQTYTVNATHPGVLAGVLPPTLNTTHQLIQNLLAADHNNSTTTTTTTTTIDDYTNHLQHNLASNQTGSRGPFTSYEWLMIVTLVTIILISIVGNLLVCVAIFTDRRLRKLGNAFIVSLAIADLFVSFLVMTFALHNDLMEEWIFGVWFCDIWISFDIMCCTASILNLCAISLDRFIHIKDCLLYNQLMTRRVAISAVIMIWIISGLVSFVPITLGWHKPSSGSVVAPGHAHGHYLATTQLPVDLIRSAASEPRNVDVDYREGERAKRAAAHLSLTKSDTTGSTGDGLRWQQQQIARQLNYSASSDPSRLQHHVPQANEPIGSADTSAQRRRQQWRRLNSATATQVADRSGGRGQGEDDKEHGQEEEDKHAQMEFVLMRRQFDQSDPATTTTRPRVATARRAERKSNLGEGKPRTATPAEQIKHLPRARRRRRRQLESLAATAAATAKLASDYEEDEPPSHGGGAEGEQTNGGSHSHSQRPPFDLNGPAREEVADGAGQANGEDEHPSARAQPPLPPPPPAAQCMLTLTPTYAVISSTISFYIPCIIMLGLYSKLFACARRHVRNIKAISKAPQPIGQGGGGNGGGGANSIATASANMNNYNGGAGASEATNNNHISTSSGSRTARSSASGATGAGPAGPLTPMVNRARRLIGGARAATGNQRKDGCITETNCGELEGGKQSPHPGGKLARLVGGARARTWIKFRGEHQQTGGGGGGESASQNSTISRCGIAADGRSPRAPPASAKDTAELGKSVVASGGLAAGGHPEPAEQRLVLKSILSNQYLVKQQQQLRCSLSGDSAPMSAPQHGTDDNTVTRSSTTGGGGSANAELEPFLANAAGSERKSVVSTNATGVKLNMIGGAASDAGAGAGATSRSQMRQTQQQQQQQREHQLHARQQQQQQYAQPLQPTKQQTSQLATHKAAITLGIIMGTFLLCWLPFFCLNIIKAFYADLIPAWLFRAFTWLGYANSALNPIIYGIHNSEFRNAFNRIFFKHLTLKNGRQYLNRRFSYDLRPHNNNNHPHPHHHHHHHNQQNNPAAGVAANRRGRGNQSQQSDVNNNRQQSQGAAVALAAAVASKTTASAQRRPNQLVGLARGESHAHNNKQQPPGGGAQAASNNLHHHHATTTSVKNNRAQGRTSSSLAMGSSLEQYHGNQQECLNLLNCLQERGKHSASTAPSLSNTTVHRTSEDLSGVKVAVAAAETAAEEQPLQQAQPQTVAIS